MKQFHCLYYFFGVLFIFCNGSICAATVTAHAPAVSPQPLTLPAGQTAIKPINDPKALAVDAEEKTYHAKPGETNASFVFNITNVSSSEVVINSVRTSCGCTLAQLPAQPWHLPPGSNGQIQVNMDLRGKFGVLAKTVSIDANTGFKMLLVKSEIPAAAADPHGSANMNRQLNMQMASADRQVIFKGECASCHVQPGKGKMGKDLYVASCGICHDAVHRASMVPDLKALKVPASLEYWKMSITHGKPNTLMPAFAQEYGGPLNAAEIASIAEYLNKEVTLNAPGAAQNINLPATLPPSIPKRNTSPPSPAPAALIPPLPQPGR